MDTGWPFLSKRPILGPIRTHPTSAHTAIIKQKIAKNAKCSAKCLKRNCSILLSYLICSTSQKSILNVLQIIARPTNLHTLCVVQASGLKCILLNALQRQGKKDYVRQDNVLWRYGRKTSNCSRHDGNFLKFVFSKKATRNYKILLSKRQIDGEDFVIFCDLLRKHEL